jgi:hypothetical protein
MTLQRDLSTKSKQAMGKLRTNNRKYSLFEYYSSITRRHCLYILHTGPCGDRGSKSHAFLDPRTFFSLKSWVWPPSMPGSMICGHDVFQDSLDLICPTLLASDMFDALVLVMQVSFQCTSHTPHLHIPILHGRAQCASQSCLASGLMSRTNQNDAGLGLGLSIVR